MSDTELKLQFWRTGQTNAERLASSVLSLSGYSEIDPQLPLGGPDGTKDILCNKGERRWVGAAYFAASQQRFSTIKKKFISDLDGALKYERNLAFITNQNLTPKQRDELHAIVESKKVFLDLFHLQRLVTTLDSPAGYGLRIEHLRIRMTTEEQLGWVEETNRRAQVRHAALMKELRAIRNSSDAIQQVQTEILMTSQMVLASKPQQTFSSDSPDLLTANVFERTDQLPALSRSLTIELVLLFHRLTCFDLPEVLLGKIRTFDVRIATADGTPSPTASPSEPKEILSELAVLIEHWNNQLPSAKTKEEKINLIAKFHHGFLWIHPFEDGNGRVARAMLMQQCLDCFGKADMTLFPRGQKYYEALQSADRGNPEQLAKLMVSLIE